MKIKFDTRYKSFHNKVVVCELYCTMKDPNMCYIPKINDCNIYHQVDGDYSFMVKGIAKCGPTEIFDLKIGKRIAESRASIKALEIINSFINKNLTMCNKALEELHKNSTKTNRILIREYEHLFTLISND